MTQLALLASLLVVLAHVAGSAEPPEADFHVAPAGTPTNPGTKEQPFATLAQARDAVRKLVAAGLKANVTVLLHGGTYELPETLAFGPEDSGTEPFAITYAAAPGEKVVVSGGRKIAGWKLGEAELWTAEVPGVKEGKWCFRQLFVNGQRAVRARTPNRDDQAACWQLRGASLAKDLKSHTYQFSPGQLKEWRNLSDVECVVFGNWEITRKRFEKTDPATGLAHMAGPHGEPHEAMMPNGGRFFYLENAIEFLDKPGEWYLDRQTGVLTYWPLPGQDMAQATAVAPMLTRLIEIKGTPERPVRNLHFKGIDFAHADWAPPPGGYLGVQACHFVSGSHWTKGWGMIEAAIRLECAESCSVENGSIAHLGGCGIELEKRCQNNLIQGNDVFDISGNGIQLGGPKDEKEVPKDNRVANNHVHDCGIDYSGAVGIWAGFTEGTVIAHNLVHALPYTGISCGWQWDPKPTPAKRNTLSFNHIYDVMNRLGDGGGIYTLGFQPGTIIRGNHIHDVHRSAYCQAAPNNGMFIDEGSKGLLFEGNVIYRTSSEPVRFNQCARDWHTWKDNQFGIAPPPVDGKVGKALACDGASTVVEVPASPQLEPEQMTLEAWICPAEIPTGKDDRRWIVNKNRNEWENGHYALMILGDKVGAYLNIGGGKDNAILASSAQPLLKPNEWHHIAMTYDGATLKVYHNGSEVGSAAINKKRVPGRTPLAIGARQDGYIHFKGAIDEVRLYNRALSADELKTHFEKPSQVADAKAENGLVGTWGFDDLADTQDAIKAITEKAGLEPPYRERLPGKEE